MKKVVFILVVIVYATVLTACISGSDEPASTAVSTGSVPAVSPIATGYESLKIAPSPDSGAYLGQYNCNHSTVEISNTLEVIISDMQLPHEGKLHGVPLSYDWAQGPIISNGNNPGSFVALTAWGAIYEDGEGNPAKNTRVQIKNIQAYVLSKQDNQWRLLQSSILVEGAAYREDFLDDYNKLADIREESDGSISVKAGDGYNFHFWTPDRVLIDPDDIAGIFTTVQARLIVDNPDYPDDRTKARYLMGMGGDYWQDLAVQWSDSKPAEIGIGRAKYVETEWKAFNMITLSEAEICRNPPPIN